MKKFISLLVITIFVIVNSFATGKGEETLKVGVTLGDIGNPFFYTMADAIEKKAKALAGDNVKVTSLSADWDLSKQFSHMDNFVSGGADIVILNAADPKGIAPSVKKAKEAGVIVLAVDVGAEGGVDATVTSNNFQAGKITAEYIVKQLNGKGNVVIINGDPVTSTLDRVRGAKSVFAKHQGINLLSENQNAHGKRDDGLKVMTDLLSAFPKIDAVWAVNDPCGIGAELAIKQAGRANEMFVVGVDGSPDAVAAIKQENSIFLASAAQNPASMAEMALEIGYKLMKDGTKPEEDLILIPVFLVTKENVASYKGWVVPK